MGALALLTISTPFALLLLLVVLGRIEQRLLTGERERLDARETVNYVHCAYERGARGRRPPQPACIRGRRPVPVRAGPHASPDPATPDPRNRSAASAVSGTLDSIRHHQNGTN